MCAVLISSLFFAFLLGFVCQQFFQDVLQFPFSLILMHQQLLELLILSIATFFPPQSEDLYILIVFQIIY